MMPDPGVFRETALGATKRIGTLSAREMLESLRAERCSDAGIGNPQRPQGEGQSSPAIMRFESIFRSISTADTAAIRPNEVSL